MSGGISFSETRYWGKAGWCYRATLSAICEALEEMAVKNDHGLLEELSDEYGNPQIIEYIEAEKWSHDKLIIFLDAVERGFKNCEKVGPKDWNDPSFFQGFMRGYKELVDMVGEIRDEISS